MATFQAIGLNLAVGSGVLVVSLVAFSFAIDWEFNALLAPRTWARPNKVIKNVLKEPYYGVSWIPWALNLTYKEMLEGIPGTGTRRNGWSGNMLRSNLDGLIIIKFHALGLKVATFATFWCMLVILPLNWTAQCDPLVSGEDICMNITGLTNFEETTLAHIPPMDFLGENTDDSPSSGLSLGHVKSSMERYFSTAPGITSRLFGIVVVAWLIYLYTCVLIWNEWIDNLALRRVFYLEHDHFEERKEELEYLESLEDPEISFQHERPPYLPHPEVRETVPNVALYSVLYKLPEYYSPTAESPTVSMLDRRLSSTVDFFDACVPNMPGFSSSVAAVTILPDSGQVGVVWKKWYACAKQLRRLRFIRKRLQIFREMEADTEEIGFVNGSTSERDPFWGNASADMKSRTSRDSRNHQTGIQFQTTCASQLDESSQPLSVTNSQDSGSSSNITLPESPRHPKMRVLATVDEYDYGTSLKLEETSSQSDLDQAWQTKTSQAPPEQMQSDSMDALSTKTRDDTMALIQDYSSGTDKVVLEGEEELTMNSEIEPSESLVCHKPNDYDQNDGVSAESTTRGSAETSMSIDTSSLPSSTSDSIPFLSGRDAHPLSSQQRLSFARFNKEKSTKWFGVSEQAQLDMFLVDDGMEQLSVYCREFAQSSASCCPYGCDYYNIIWSADLETLKELEEEAAEMVQKANAALMESRAQVNIMDVELPHEQSIGSFIAQRQTRDELRNTSDLEECADENDPAARVELQNIGTSNNRRRSESADHRWAKADEIANENRQHNNARRRKKQAKTSRIPSGRWHVLIGDPFRNKLRKRAEQNNYVHATFRPERTTNHIKGVVSRAVDQHTYAVVTFTSRQAAIAARQCLADGSGLGRWEEIEDIPIPPLADGLAWDILFCSRICRPVTFTINDNQKRCRNNLTILCLTLFCFLYTIPLSLTSNLLSQEQLTGWFPNFEAVGSLSGILTGLLYTVFFSICPFIFKAFANFGSGATSQRQAEFRAIRYYWIFILVTAFTGSSLATMVTTGLYSGLNLGASTQEVLRTVAKAIPTTVSATWLNWIIVRFLFTVPVLYLFQSNTFLFRMLGMECCARCMRGGGPGGPMPFRIYVDSGVVFLCVVALAPACPLVAPAAMMYFLLFAPVLRWLLIFVYRPVHDGGGLRWPLLHDILISSLIVSQILLTTMMVLKKAYGPALLASLSLIPTFSFGQIAKERFLGCYRDAGLIQTSQLDGWNRSESASIGDREDFRRWLVDCHKASYVPICLASRDSFLTAEPAVAIPTDRDLSSAATPEWQSSPVIPLTPTNDSVFGIRSRTNTMDSVVGLRPRTDTMNGVDGNRSPTNILDSISGPVKSMHVSQRGATFRRVAAAGGSGCHFLDSSDRETWHHPGEADSGNGAKTV